MDAKVQTVDRGEYKDSKGVTQFEDYWLLIVGDQSRPGHFISVDVAEYAMEFDDHTLEDLQDRANDRSVGTLGIITQRDLEMAYIRAEVLHIGEHLAREEWLAAGMTPDEVIIFTIVVALWNRIVDLPVIRQVDADQYIDAVHMIQDKIAARPFFRAVNTGESDA